MSARLNFSTTCLVVVATSLLGARGAHAQAELVPTDSPKPVDTKVVITGWNPFFGLTSTLNMVSNSNVIGQVDGVSTLFGLGLLGGADYIDGKHLLQTTLSADESFSVRRSSTGSSSPTTSSSSRACIATSSRSTTVRTAASASRRRCFQAPTSAARRRLGSTRPGPRRCRSRPTPPRSDSQARSRR